MTGFFSTAATVMVAVVLASHLALLTQKMLPLSVVVQLANSVATQFTACRGQSRIDPCTGIYQTQVGVLKIVASTGIARRECGSVQRWHLGQ